MSKIMDAEDILADARNCVECIFLAASGLGGGLKHEATDPIHVVADMASKKIEEAIAILEEYRGGPDASQLPAAPAAKPVPPAARTKRSGKLRLSNPGPIWARPKSNSWPTCST